jgi:hypothetical protein
MSRFIPRGAVALPALLIALGTGTALALAAQAAGSWSPPVQLPAWCGGSVAVNAAGAQAAVGYHQNADGSMPVQACTSTDGQTWSAPVTLAQGVSPAVAIAPDGRAVAVWTGATIQASVRPPGGQWSTPVTVSTDAYTAPAIGIDGSGNAIAAWEGGSFAIDTASLPAGGRKWTKVTTLAPRGQAVALAVNPAGAAIITWGTQFATLADSGTVLGGFAAPVTIGPPPPYPIGYTHVAINDAGQAAAAWATGANVAATRSADGTWSPPTQLSAIDGGPVDVAIDGTGDAIAVFEQTIYGSAGSYTTPMYASTRPAGGTWGPPALLSAPGDSATGTRAVADTAGTFVIAWDDSTTQTLNVLTSPPGGGFAPAATFPGVPALRDLKIAPGHAVLTFGPPVIDATSTQPMSISSEPVS